MPAATDHRVGSDPAEITLLRSSVRESLATLFPGCPDDGWAQSWPQSWDALRDQGLWSAIEPPDGSLAMAVVVAAELGRALYPGPGCDALAATCLTTEHDSAILVVAHDPAVRVPEHTTLLIADESGLTSVRAGDAHVEELSALDVTRDWVRYSIAGDQVADVERTDRALAVRALLYCADTLGSVQQVLDRTVEYAKQRTTFGAPIGKYQAVAHRLVDHEVMVRQLRLTLAAAVAALDSESADWRVPVTVAQTLFWGRGAEIISDCIQLCGGIGFTWEWGHHFHLRRVVANDAIACGPGRPHHRLAEEMGW
ncbi:acyl-CoA dehydrogenase family protein [Mycobacterium sp. ACS4331]|uniref:acyl-CoA dehydrogenase family protein n=1 Tax=Mycobacterium sp. ACS4331 TaxID=1834121 RepID=UPI00080110A4|nr:acyl-CoA dehydrogenase family protein [Mycobacterium sp. ACS4331]OBF25424.1 hypothetical protein A5727_04655 [Mycobacterium sp. ACS4331]